MSDHGKDPFVPIREGGPWWLRAALESGAILIWVSAILIMIGVIG